jgi:hypothetical protein
VRGIEEMLRLLKGLPDRFEVCYEASCGYDHYHDLLRPLAARVLVAHPGQLRLAETVTLIGLLAMLVYIGGMGRFLSDFR